MHSAPPSAFPPPVNEGWIGPIHATGLPPSKPPPDGTAVISVGTLEGDNIIGARYWIKLPESTSATIRAFWQGQL